MMVGSEKSRATYADLEAVPEHLVAEIIDGELMTHRHGTFLQALTRTALGYTLRSAFQAGRGQMGGWQILNLPELHLGSQIVVPELCGWRTSRLPVLPDDHIPLPPDWVCEVLSSSTEKRDRTLKMRIYGQAGVAHMWLIDPRLQLLEVFELVTGRWMKIGDWNSDDEVRALPFDAISFSLADLWPLDKPLGFNEDPTPYYAGDR